MNTTKLDTLRREFQAKLQENEMCEEKLHAERRSLEKCQNQIGEIFPQVLRYLDETQSELWSKNANEDMRELGMITEQACNNFAKVRHALEDELDNIEHQRRTLANEKEQIEAEYKKSITQLEEK